MEQYLDQVKAKLAAIIQDSDYFLVDMKVKPTNNLKIYLDGDNGITISAISNINRALRNQIDEEGWYPEGDYSIEISSPGVDTPLRFSRQYKKHIGRELEIVLNDEAATTVTGKLISINDDIIVLEEAIGKKKEIKTHEFPLESIKSAVVQVSFK